MLVLALFTALALFALMLAFQLAGAPIGSDGGDDSVPMLAAVALILALMITAIQIAALGVIRLLPWQGPSLNVDEHDHLRHVFE